MNNKFIYLILTFILLLTELGIIYAQEVKFSAFEPGIISSSDLTDTSPSVTADGKTMVFARTADWRNKVPFIAHKKDEIWTVSRLPFADTLYNLAISPDGNAIFYKQFLMEEGEEVTRAFFVEKSGIGWSAPQEIESLFNTNAGYFDIMKDGTLYLFGRIGDKNGIYTVQKLPSGKYGKPKWLSNKVSPPGTTSFDAIIDPSETKLIITRAGIDEQDEERLGQRGFYYHEKVNGEWDSGIRLNLPYGWGAEILGDSLLFVHDNDIQITSLNQLGINWN